MNPFRVVVVLLALASLLLLSATPVAAGKPRSERGELVHRIVMKWGGHVQRTYGVDPRGWAMDMVPVFAKAPLPALRRALGAPTFQEMNDAFLVDEQGNTSHTRLAAALNAGTPAAPGKVIGDVAEDLVFVPVTPCRIIDTRVAGGAIAANTVRSFAVSGAANYTAQGGDAGNCGVGGAGPLAAAAINFTVVSPAAAGYITAFPFGAAQPLAATVNYTAGDIRGNFGIVKVDQSAAVNDLSVYTFAQTHVVADVVGYFIAPEATALDCVETTSTTVTIAAGDFGTRTTSACPSGYTFVGGGCTMSDFDGRMVSSRPQVVNHFCAWRNEGTSSVQGIAYARCCRLPGR